MLNTVRLQIEAFTREIEIGYRRMYGDHKPEYWQIMSWVGSTAIEIIATSSALYHNTEHSILVTLVGQHILHGKHIREGGVTPEDWLHVMISLVCHDLGYVRGVCRQDRGAVCATGKNGETVTLKPGATDAALTPHHVDRGKLAIKERFGGHAIIDVDRVLPNIEHTRFPVPGLEDDNTVVEFQGVVRAADLIGQLSDPRYFTKVPALYYEFLETGVAQKLGYEHPGDVRSNYPKFYWNSVFPHIKSELAYLAVTQEGQQVRANLFANVFMVEHEGPLSER